MNNHLFINSILNDKFYENYSMKTVNDEFINIVTPKLIDNWTIKKERIFFNAYHEQSLPSQGWKIHLSATVKNAKDILNIASDILIKNGISFKFLLDMDTLKITSQKAFPRESYGKFITIYPANVDQFKFIIDILYKSLKDFEGPYILSDKRYLDCKVLYYRYGGFLPNFRYDTEGNPIPFILDGQGNPTIDRRLPYFQLPNGIDDVFPNTPNDTSSNFKEKYELIKAIRFTNSGGVYIANQKSNNQLVIVKEARPYTQIIDENIDAVFIRKEESRRLEELHHTGYIPNIIDSFYEWEHFFIVEEYIEGYTLDEFVIKNAPIPRMGTDNQVNQYFIDITNIFIKLSDFLVILHQNNMMYSDFSLDNIIITPNFDVKIIDLEGCVHNDSSVYRMVTNGFYDSIKTNNIFASDIYGLGCLLFSCILKKTNMINIQPNTIEIFLNSITEEYSIPIEFKTLVQDMTSYNIENRPTIDEVKNRLTQILLILKANPILKKHFSLNTRDLKTELSESINLGVIGVIKSKNETSTCIFPNTPILPSNLNISTGLAGIIRGLNHLNISLYNQDFLNYSKEIPNTEPLGLYVGISGVIWTMLEIGEITRAQELFDKYILTCKFENDFSVFSGTSGIGLLCLKLYLYTNNDAYLKQAVKYGDDIMLNLSPDKTKDIGYKKGLSGISLFLLYLHIITKNESYISFGKALLLYELNYKVRYDSFDNIDFRSNKDSKIASPYFIEGTCGILSVLVRYYNYTKCSELFNHAIELADSLYSKYPISPTLFKGLSGIANTLLDCYYILKDEKYKKTAYIMAKECLNYQIKYQDGVLYPDLYINKLSTDFGYGTMGILMFFNRLLKGEKKNFCFFLDELLDY